MPNDRPYRPMRETLSIIAITLAALALIALLYEARLLILASLIGIGFGVLVAPIMSVLHKRFKIPRILSAAVLMVLILGGTAGVAYGLGVLISDQAESFVRRAPELFEKASKLVERVLARYPWVAEQANRLNLNHTARSALSGLFQGLQTGVAAVAGALVIFALGAYTAISAPTYYKGLLSTFPAYKRAEAAKVLKEAASTLRNWFKAQLAVMGISGAATTLGLGLLGIDYWLLLGVLTGILGFIPFVGVTITALATTLVTLGTQPEKIVWVLLVYFGIQQLEDNVALPLLMRGGVHLPEVHLIVFMLIMGSLFGILGIFVAPPLLAVLRCVYLMTYSRSMDRKTRPPEEIRRAA